MKRHARHTCWTSYCEPCNSSSEASWVADNGELPETMNHGWAAVTTALVYLIVSDCSWVVGRIRLLEIVASESSE